MVNRIWYQASKPEMEFNILNMIYAALPRHAQTEKTTNLKTTVYWGSTHGAEYIPHCASNTTFVVLVVVGGLVLIHLPYHVFYRILVVIGILLEDCIHQYSLNLLQLCLKKQDDPKNLDNTERQPQTWRWHRKWRWVQKWRQPQKGRWPWKWRWAKNEGDPKKRRLTKNEDDPKIKTTQKWRQPQKKWRWPAKIKKTQKTNQKMKMTQKLKTTQNDDDPKMEDNPNKCK